MPQRLIVSIKTVIALIGIITGCFGAFQSYAILPYRLQEVEKKAELARLKAEVDHDLIIKMSSDISYIREQFSNNGKK